MQETSSVVTESKSKQASRRFVVTLSVVLSATALFAVLVLAFKADASVTYRNETANGEFIPTLSLRPTRESNATSLGQYPLSMSYGAVGLTVAGASISLALALSVGIMCILACHRGKALLVSRVFS